MGEITRPWLVRPGEVWDCNGVPIYPGDLFRTPHYRDRRRRQHYLYHTVVRHWDGQVWALRLVPTSHLEPTKARGGGDCLLTPELAAAGRVIYGHGPGDYLDYTDRPRRKAAAAKGEA